MSLTPTVESQWAENLRTVEGNLLHERAHDETIRETRGDLVSVRGVNIHSPELGVSGKCDVLEFRRSDCGIPLDGHDAFVQIKILCQAKSMIQLSCLLSDTVWSGIIMTVRS